MNRIAQAETEGEDVTLDALLEEIGRRSFGPMILVAGLVTLAPLIGDIPGVPTIMGMFVLLTAVQMLFHREHVWLPRWLLKQSVKRDTLCKALELTAFGLSLVAHDGLLAALALAITAGTLGAVVYNLL